MKDLIRTYPQQRERVRCDAMGPETERIPHNRIIPTNTRRRTAACAQYFNASQRSQLEHYHHCYNHNDINTNTNTMSNYPGYNPGQFQQPGHGFAPPPPNPPGPGAPGMNPPPPMMQPGQGFAAPPGPGQGQGPRAPMGPGQGFAPPPPGPGQGPPPPGPGGMPNPTVGLNQAMGRMSMNPPPPGGQPQP